MVYSVHDGDDDGDYFVTELNCCSLLVIAFVDADLVTDITYTLSLGRTFTLLIN